MPPTPPEDGADGSSRSQRKRRAILDAARELFLRHGYLGTSMDDVAAHAHVSKQTVYKHATDKQSLFETVVLERIEASADETRELLDTLPDRTDFPAALREFARQHLAGVLDPTVVALRRTIIGEATRFPDLARTWWEHGPQAGHLTLADVLVRAAARGHLRPLDDPLAAAEQLNWLVLSRPLNEVMFLGDAATLTDDERSAIADEAVRVFLAAYGPAPAATAP